MIRWNVIWQDDSPSGGSSINVNVHASENKEPGEFADFRPAGPTSMEIAG